MFRASESHVFIAKTTFAQAKFAQVAIRIPKAADLYFYSENRESRVRRSVSFKIDITSAKVGVFTIESARAESMASRYFSIYTDRVCMCVYVPK